MRLQVDLEFELNEIKRLNEKYNLEMFSSHVRGGQTYAVEQITREFKMLLLQSKKYTRKYPPALDWIQKN